MNRQEFSEILSKYRRQSNISAKELCFKLRYMPSDLYKLENAKHSYNLQKCFDYLNAINVSLVISTTDGTKSLFEDYTALLDFVTNTRISQGYSQRSLALKAGINRATIVYFEKQKTVMTIDTFLKIIDVFEMSISISPKS